VGDVRHPQHPRRGGAAHGPTAVTEVLGVDVRLAGGVRIVVETLPFFEGSGDLYSWLSNHYCRVERNRTGDVATPIARRDHRKSKFGLRHGIKLIEFYAMTKFEF
jgi:hypothetical protein